VLTMVLQRENVKSPGGGNHIQSQFGSTRDTILDPMDRLQATAKYTLSFYRNGKDMEFHLKHLIGPFYLCLNYYFVESKIRLVSDYNFRKKYQHWVRVQSRQISNPDPKGASEGGKWKVSYITRMS